MSRPILYSQLGDAQKDAMIRIFARDYHAIALFLNIDQEVELRVRQPAPPIAYGSAISDALIRAHTTVADIARVLRATVPAAFHDPVVGALLHESFAPAASPASRAMPAPAVLGPPTTYAQLTVAQRDAMMRLFEQGCGHMFASVISVSSEVGRLTPSPGTPAQHASALSQVLTTHNTPLENVAAAFSLVCPRAFLDPHVGPLLQNPRTSAPAAAAPAEQRVREWTTMLDVSAPIQLELKDFFASPETGGAEIWLTRFGADRAVRSQLTYASPDNMALGLVNYLRQQAYPLPDLAHLVVHHVPAAVRDPDLGEFFRVHANRPSVCAAQRPAAAPTGTSRIISDLPGPTRVELMDFFADPDNGGIEMWLKLFGVKGTVLAQLPSPASVNAQARAFVGILGQNAYPVPEFVEVVLDRVPMAIYHPTLGKFFQDNQIQ